MLKFTRKNKKLVIPVGINPSYNIDSSTLYNVSDADVVANDVIAGKIAYGADGKIVGTLDVESEKATSFENGYAAGQEYGYESGYSVGREEGFDAGIEDQKAKLETITITENGTYNREDGYNEVIVEVPDLNGDYNEGYSDGVVAGREEIITEQSDATITPQTVFKGEIGYGSNNEKIVGEYEFVEGFDFGVIGYSQEESNEVNRSISDDIAYSKQLLDEWNSGDRNSFKNLIEMKYMPYVDTSNITNMNQFATSNINLSFVPLLNTSKVTNMYNMFYQCSNLTSVPLFDTSKVTNMDGMFISCSKLTTIPQFNTSNVTDMEGMFSGCSNLTSVPLFDTSNVTDMYGMFQNCSSLTTIPQFNTSNVTDMRNMFNQCLNLTLVPLFDTSKVTNMSNMFLGCSNLTSVPTLNTSNCQYFGSMFQHCQNLTSAPLLDTSKATNINSMFSFCISLTSVPEYNASSITSDSRYGACLFGTLSYQNINSITEFGGLLDLGKSYGSSPYNEYKDLLLHICPNLTYESCMNVINKVYDLNLNTENTIVPNIKFSATSYSLLSDDDIAIATAKGWSVISA